VPGIEQAPDFLVLLCLRPEDGVDRVKKNGGLILAPDHAEEVRLA
jgi:hypothetical protein